MPLYVVGSTGCPASIPIFSPSKSTQIFLQISILLLLSLSPVFWGKLTISPVQGWASTDLANWHIPFS